MVGTDSDYIGKSFDVRSMERMKSGSRRGSSFTIVEVISIIIALRTCATYGY